jgi:hypothetical protein
MAHAESESYMSSFNQTTFLGSQNIGKTGNVTMSWAILIDSQANESQPPSTLVNLIQPATEGKWFFYDIDPVAAQGSFTFGAAVAMQLQITRVKSWFVSDVSFLFSGRVIVFVPSTGQFYVFAPKDILAFNVNASPEANGLEVSNDVVPLSLAQGAHLQVWMESDVLDGDAAGVASTVAITLFNFPISPVSVN